MFARVLSGALNGVDAHRIDVEVDCCGGIGQISLVGLPDAAVKESQERVRSAIKACGYHMPYAKKWVVNLAPADTRKEGPIYDLPIAIGILASCGLMPMDNLRRLWLVGELGLDGSVRPVSGVLPLAIACRESGAIGIIVPDANAEEASLVDGLFVFPVNHLRQATLIVEELNNGAPYDGTSRESFLREASDVVSPSDFSDVKGQLNPQTALEAAAAGRHNVLMVGPPGSGKSMLAERMPGIMPPLTFDEAIELTKLYSVAGLTQSASLVKHRPFRSPHHSSSIYGLIGGGPRPKPGEISLSHLGILFLDELTEFPKHHLDNLRQPMETHKVTISRAAQTLTYPASFLLIGACNPCPCGYKGDRFKVCICSPYQAARYWSRLSGPLLDRFDIQIEVFGLTERELTDAARGESSREKRKRVMRAVNRQMVRNVVGRSERDEIWGEQVNPPFVYNGQLSQKLMNRVCHIPEKLREELAKIVTANGLSARAYDRILRLSRTIADLADSDVIERGHVMGAIGMRISNERREPC